MFGPLFNSIDDPLGISLRERAADRRRQMENQQLAAGRFMPMSTVLRDPAWDAYFQALDEAGVDEMADASVGSRTKRGKKGAASFAPSIYSLLNEDSGRSF